MHKIAICAALLMGGCAQQAQQQWAKPGMTASQFEQDELACKYEAKKATIPVGNSGDSFVDGVTIGLRELELKNMCLQTRGYKRT